jgi:hypothetical protein
MKRAGEVGDPTTFSARKHEGYDDGMRRKSTIVARRALRLGGEAA